MTKIALFAAGAALLIVSPASAQYHSQHSYSSHQSSYGHKTYHHQPSYHSSQQYYKPSYSYQPTYHKPVYVQPHEVKKVEVCFKWIKEGYGHATKVIIPCPEHVVIKKEVTVEKKEEAPVEQK